jgi:hypothetical protein
MLFKHRVVRAYQIVKTKKKTITRHPRRKSKGICDWGKTKRNNRKSKSETKQERLLQGTMRMRGRRAKYNAMPQTLRPRSGEENGLRSRDESLVS